MLTMQQNPARPPMHFKLLNFDLPGKIAGSAQPGGHISLENILQVIAELETGALPNDPRILTKLTSNLDFLRINHITVIYNLISPPNALIKYFWETHYDGVYITKINDVDTAIKDNEPPSPEQFQLIIDDAIVRMNKGENILFHCVSGLGRTGTILAAIYMKAKNIDDGQIAIEYIRRSYSKYAVESGSQESSLQSRRSFIDNLETEIINNNVKEYGSVSQKILKNNKVSPLELGNQSVKRSKPDLDSANTSESLIDNLKTHEILNAENVIESGSTNQNLDTTSDCCIVSYCAILNYDNPLLNYQELVCEAVKAKQLSNLLELGLDQQIADSIIEATEQYGAQHVISILFPTTEALSTDSPLSSSNTKVIQIIDNLIHNLRECLDFSCLYESIDIDNHITIILSQIHNWLDYTTSGTTYIGLPPRYTDFDPGYGSSGGGKSYGNNSDDSQNIALPILFIGQNTTAYLEDSA